MQDTGLLALLDLNTRKAIIEYVDAKIADGIAANTTSINNLNTWAGTLATKLNADAGVTDTDYDTNPQA